MLTQRKVRAFRNCWLLKRCDWRCPGGWPIPSSVRYHALALSLRVGGGTILPTRRRRGRSTPAPATLDRSRVTLRSSWRRSRLLRSRGYPAEFMEARPSLTQSRLSCEVQGGEAVSHAVEAILRSSWRRSRLSRSRGYPDADDLARPRRRSGNAIDLAWW